MGTTVNYHIDTEGEDVWIEALHPFIPEEMSEALGAVDAAGYMLIDDEEEPPTLTPAGVRRYARIKV